MNRLPVAVDELTWEEQEMKVEVLQSFFLTNIVNQFTE